MGVTSIQTLINGKNVKEPIDWQNNTIHASFGTDSVQPQIETDSFEFVLNAAEAIIKHKDSGDIFEPLPCQQIYSQRDNEYVSLDGYIDVSDGYQEISPTWGSIEKPNRVLVKFKQNESITSFTEQIQGVTFGSLLEEGLISSQDYTTIKTAIVKKANFLEVATSIITIYLIQKQIRDSIKEIQKTIVDIAGAGLAAGIVATALAVIQIAYAVALIALLVKLVKSLIDLLIPPIIKNKGIKFRTLLEKSCSKFGYNFVSPIEELDTYYYLPSKPYSNETKIFDNLIPKYVANEVGIPSTSDFGYLINEFWDLMKSMFNTKIAVDGNDIILRNADDTFWVKNSDFKPYQTINFPTKSYNTQDLKQTRMMTFTTDINDEWTTENYTGTSYEIKTESTSNSVNNSIKGLERIDIPLCLPNNKVKTSPIEDLMISIARFADDLAGIIGKKSNFMKQIQNNRINVLKVSQNDYSIAKIVPLISNQLPPNHRDLLSAKTLMNKYHFGKSFVGDALGQKVIYNDVDIPFVLSDLLKTLKNGTFILSDGRVAEFINIDYNFSKDTANCSLSVQEVYTKKLKEVTYEP